MSYPTKVTTIAENMPERVQVIDHDSLESRRWLERHIVWAIHNEATVIVEATDHPVNYYPSTGVSERSDARKAFRLGRSN